MKVDLTIIRRTHEDTEMNKALSNVHISFDMWISPNGIATLLVIAYYADIAKRPQFRLLSLEKLSGSHGGEDQAILMAKVIQKYGLEKKIELFATDNAHQCDTCIRALLKMFYPRVSPTELERLEDERQIRSLTTGKDRLFELCDLASPYCMLSQARYSNFSLLRRLHALQQV